MSALDYRIVDVFSDRAFAGNQLAVVLGAESLSTAQCQLLAAEFHLSETAFPMASSAVGADYRIRIFTPTAELPFAGHPSIGTAWVQRDNGALPADAIAVVQDCGAGLLPLEFRPDGSIELTGGAPVVGVAVPPSAAASVVTGCGLTAEDLVGPVRVASSGLPYAVVPVRPDAIGRARAMGGLTAVPDDVSWTGTLLVAWDVAARRAHVRMFAPDVGVTEDPATGSAAVALGAYLVEERLLPGDGDSSFEIRQGAEIGRPSRLYGRVSAADGHALTSRVAGHVVPVAEGRIRRPRA